MANETGYRPTRHFTDLDESDYCDHCSKEDLSKAVGFFFERDSCGYVFKYVVCEPCKVACKEAEGKQPVVCHDCGQTVERKDSIEWRWYDFYAPQGDEPLVICNTCKDAEKHKQRVAKDDADYRSEFPNQFADDDDDDIEIPDEDDEPLEDD